MTEAGIYTYLYARRRLLHGRHVRAGRLGLRRRPVRRLWPLFNEEYGTASYLSTSRARRPLRRRQRVPHHPCRYRSWRPGTGADLPTPAGSRSWSRRTCCATTTTRSAPAERDSTRIDLPPQDEHLPVLDGRLTQDGTTPRPARTARRCSSRPGGTSTTHRSSTATATPTWTRCTATPRSTRGCSDHGSRLVRADIDRVRVGRRVDVGGDCGEGERQPLIRAP